MLNSSQSLTNKSVMFPPLGSLLVTVGRTQFSSWESPKKKIMDCTEHQWNRSEKNCSHQNNSFSLHSLLSLLGQCTGNRLSPSKVHESLGSNTLHIPAFCLFFCSPEGKVKDGMHVCMLLGWHLQKSIRFTAHMQIKTIWEWSSSLSMLLEKGTKIENTTRSTKQKSRNVQGI